MKTIQRNSPYWIFLVIFHIGLSAVGQELQDKYPFLKLDQNEIDFYGDSSKFNTFFDKLDNVILTGEGQVNVLHIGGSHVQGGTLEKTSRENLQSLAPGLKSHRGLMFPYTLAETNNPFYYVVKKRGKWAGDRVSVSNHHSEWGVSGVTATTYSPTSSAAMYAREIEDRFDFTKARIYYHQCECSFQPVIENVDLVATRIDSVGKFFEAQFSQPQDTLYLALSQTDTLQSQFVLQGIQLLSEQPGVIYNTIGVNGAKTGDFFRGENFKDQVKMITPDLVIFGIGINDANTYAKKFNQKQYEKNYTELVETFRESNPDVAILFMTNNDSYFQKRYPNPNIYKVREAMINVSKQIDGAVWDFFEVMGGFDSIRYWEAYNLGRPDKIHFSREGYALQSRLLFTALRQSYGDYLSARFQRQP